MGEPQSKTAGAASVLTQTESNPTSGALQHKPHTGDTTYEPHKQLSNHELHRATLDARDEAYKRCIETEKHISQVLLPYCEEVITRYKLQGVAAKDRPNGKPTVEVYFKSIDLNYNTVRSWIHRRKLQTEMFEFKNLSVGNNSGTNNLKKPPATESAAASPPAEDVGQPFAASIQVHSSPEQGSHAPTLPQSSSVQILSEPELSVSSEATAHIPQSLPLEPASTAPDSTEPPSVSSEEQLSSILTAFDSDLASLMTQLEKRCNAAVAALFDELNRLYNFPKEWNQQSASRCLDLLDIIEEICRREARVIRRHLKETEARIRHTTGWAAKVRGGVRPLLDDFGRPSSEPPTIADWGKKKPANVERLTGMKEKTCFSAKVIS